MTIYEQLRQWQQIPHARQEWGDYRRKLTDFVVAHTDSESSAAILGAGACGDLDLVRLAGHFGKIILVDQDTGPSGEACRLARIQLDKEANRLARARLDKEAARLVQTQPEKEIDQMARPRQTLSAGGIFCQLSVEAHDLLGIRPEEYETYTQILQDALALRGRNTDISDLAETARRFLGPLYEKVRQRPLVLVTEPVDYIICAGLHSQLDNMTWLIWNAYEQALDQHWPRIYPYFAKECDASVARLDQCALETARKGLVFALEKARLGIPGSVQGAARGICDIDRFVREGDLNLLARENICWNFDTAQGIAYEMSLLAGEK